jgi:glutaminyl-peptide cyclotransferase
MAIFSLTLMSGFTSCSDKPKTQTETKQPPSAVVVPEFNADNAYDIIAKQVAFGSRVPNSKAHNDCRAYLVAELGKYCDTVIEQKTTQNVYNTAWKLTNIIGQINPKATQRVMLCAHWDSRPRSDEDTIPANKNKGIPGANDGASGVGILVEIARVLSSTPQNVGVDIVLFDGEDIGYSTDAENFCIGSKYFAQNFPLVTKPRYAILLDLVGDTEAQFFIEQQSYQSAQAVVERVWTLGKEHGGGMFVNQMGGAITDDHVQLIRAGIPAIDIIDMELVGNSSTNPRRKYWHTQNDNMENISKNTLNNVGTVLLNLLYNNPIIL